jgi:ferredoxin-NADP reductase
LRGPIGGHFVWEVADGGPLLLLGGGSGVVPLMSMIRHRAQQNSRVPTLLLSSARTFGDVLFRDELLALQARGDGFELALALTREPAKRARDFWRRVDTGMLTELLARLPQAPKQVFVCGSNPFVEAAADATIGAGIAPGLIRTERYGG